MRPDQILAAVVVLFGGVLAALAGFLQYRSKQTQQAKNQAAEAQRGQQHAEADARLARETDAQIDADLRRTLGEPPRDGKG